MLLKIERQFATYSQNGKRKMDNVCYRKAL